ncbi:MAG: restriction endonuclease subunit S [Acidobacteria bacterium]|nr:restriction endonuclease subunit S [Acidobacteriota bacterium]
MSGVPTGWASDRLKDVAAINAVALSAGTDPDYEFDYLEISNVDYHGIVDPNAIERLRFEDAPSRARRGVAAGSTVISSVRPNLQAVAFFPDAPPHFVCSTGFNVVEPQPSRLSPQFAYYHLISENARQYLEAAATGVGYPAVGDKEFNAIAVSLPPLPEQQRIAAYLDASCAAIDAAVTAKRRQLDTLDALRKAIIQRAVTRGISDRVVLESTGNAWMESIPRGWRLVCLKRIAEIQGGLTLGKQYDGPLIERPYLRVGNVQDGHLDLADVSVIELPASVAAGVELRPNDVLMTEGGDLDKLGRGHVWKGEIPGCLHQNHIFAVRCTLHKLKPTFLAYVTAAKYGRDYFEATGKKTTNLACTNATKVGEFPIPLPPLTEQEAICAHLEEELGELKGIVSCIESQIATLTAYRKSLIHECVTGRRQVTDEDVRRAGHSERSQPTERMA